MADARLEDPDFLAGRVLALEADLARETERADLVVLGLRGLRDDTQELTSEVVRLGGEVTRVRQIAEHIARHLGLNPDDLEPIPDVPRPRRSPATDRAIKDLERIPTRVDREELERPGPVNGKSAPPAPPKTSLPITRSWRPVSFRDWVKLLVAFVLAVTALAGAAQQIAQSLRAPAPPASAP